LRSCKLLSTTTPSSTVTHLRTLTRPRKIETRNGAHSDDEDTIHFHELDDGDEDDSSSSNDEIEYSDDEDWVEVPAGQRDRLNRDPHPEESASHARRPPGSVRYRSTSRPSARRSQSSRRLPEVVEPPPGPPPGHIRKVRRPASRPRSVTEPPMAEDDDYPAYPPRHGGYYHPSNPWGRDGPPMFPPGPRSNYSGEPYGDGYSDNPFSAPPDQYGYNRRGNRMSMPHPPRTSGQELMSMNHGFSPYMYPPMPGMGYYPYPSPPEPTPARSKKTTPTPPPPPPPAPAPVEEKENPHLNKMLALLEEQNAIRLAKEAAEKSAAVQAKIVEEQSQLNKLTSVILQTTKIQEERDKKWLAERQAEIKAKEDAEAKAAAEGQRIAEETKKLKQAAELAKLEAENEAAKKAAAEKEKNDKAAAEAKEKHEKAAAEEKEKYEKELEELKAQKKKFEEEAKRLRPTDDMLKAPIRFKDAVGRKYSFPWHICKTWKVCLYFLTEVS
jgi:hypothetical protein